MRCFVDTNAWVAWAQADEPGHRRALETLRSVPPDRVVTSDHVIGETFTRLRTKRGYAAAARAGAILLDESYVRWESVTPEDFGAAWAMFSKYGDKELSFTDCTVLVQPERLGIGPIFAFDDDFRKMGRRVIPG